MKPDPVHYSFFPDLPNSLTFLHMDEVHWDAMAAVTNLSARRVEWLPHPEKLRIKSSFVENERTEGLKQLLVQAADIQRLRFMEYRPPGLYPYAWDVH